MVPQIYQIKWKIGLGDSTNIALLVEWVVVSS